MDKKDAYNELLKDPRWQKRRLEIFERDNWTCQICGTKDKMLHVHHIAYIKNRKPWDYPDNLLITLCEECHKEDKKNRDSINTYIENMRNYGLTNYEISRLLEMVEIQIIGMHHDDCIFRMCGGSYEEFESNETESDPYSWPFPCLKRLAERRIRLGKKDD